MGNREPIARDELLKEVSQLLGSSIYKETHLDDTIVMVGGDPGEVVVRVGRSRVSVALFMVCWKGPHTPVVQPVHFATLKTKNPFETGNRPGGFRPPMPVNNSRFDLPH